MLYSIGINQGITWELAWAFSIICLIGLLLTYKQLGFTTALFISLIKAGLPLIYFSYLFNEQWLMKDDRVYHELTYALFELGYGPWRMLTEDRALKDVKEFIGSGHMFYYWWTLLAFHVIGKLYYAPVFLNVALTFASGAALHGLVKKCGFSDKYANTFLIFFLLHWDILTWSSFVSLKDMWVLFLTISSFLLISRLIERITIMDLFWLGLCFFIFTMLRFYIPILIVMAGLAWLLLQWKDSRKYLLIPLVLMVLLLFLPEDTRTLRYIQVGSPFNAIRFLMMPQFWSVAGVESILYVSAVFHWIFMGPAIFGAYWLARRSLLARMVLLYALIIVAFYSIVPILQGYRHRMQITFVIAWCQFHAIWVFTGVEDRLRKASSRASA